MDMMRLHTTENYNNNNRLMSVLIVFISVLTTGFVISFTTWFPINFTTGLSVLINTWFSNWVYLFVLVSVLPE